MAAFVGQLRLEHQVVLHGWSMGGLVAGLIPNAVRGVVLAAPTLPRHLTSRVEALGWETAGRLAVTAGPPTARLLLRLGGRRILNAKRVAMNDARAVPGGGAGLVGGDPALVSGEQVDLWLEGLAAAGEHPDRLAGSAAAFASTIRAMFITQRSTNRALDATPAPVLLLWGTGDPLVDATSLLQHAQRPGGTPRPISKVGHLLPVEAPQVYAQAVSQWLPTVTTGHEGPGSVQRPI